MSNVGWYKKKANNGHNYHLENKNVISSCPSKNRPS